MAIVNVHKYKYGFSLIELLVASSISLIALAVVSSVFISGLNSTSKRSLQLMLAQDTNDALKMMKEDILRAGFNSNANSSFIISGAVSTVYINPASSGKSTCIAYGYNDGSNKHYRFYHFENSKLKFSSPSDLSTSNACIGGKSALHDEQLKVTRFEVIEKKLTHGSINSQYITINLEVATRDDVISSAKTVTVKTRNWN
ncbi:PilW family protein [uncultured Photobacterium sp.]|uniref:PilW family protein n=1 Tax=uncultured Photobacterium sp. TaxID=173973 RepID=UPI00261D66AA|nr:prepilin-type N-terminal cleavage/methylation domain-containing protein [uncultured Photobacterium sp.]